MRELKWRDEEMEGCRERESVKPTDDSIVMSSSKFPMNTITCSLGLSLSIWLSW